MHLHVKGKISKQRDNSTDMPYVQMKMAHSLPAQLEKSKISIQLPNQCNLKKAQSKTRKECKRNIFQRIRDEID